MEIDTSTAEGRAERARLAAASRWNKRFDWETETIEKCQSQLADLRAEAEKGGLILQRRMSTERVNSAICYNPDCHKGPDGRQMQIDIGSGRFAGSKSRINPETGVLETAYACSAACYLYLSSNFRHSPSAEREPVREVNPEVVNNQAAIPKI